MSARKKIEQVPRIQKITVAGYKSIRDERTIELGGLTILAGANSSGKSSIMQPLLLLKQTLEAPYDPGPLLLNGPNVKFTSVKQMFASIGDEQVNVFTVGFEISQNDFLSLKFDLDKKKEIALKEMTVGENSVVSTFFVGMQSEAIRHNLLELIPKIMEIIEYKPEQIEYIKYLIVRERCLLEAAWQPKMRIYSSYVTKIGVGLAFIPYLKSIIHLPGLRGMPERTYPITAVENTFPGTFENYAASVLAQWGRDGKRKLLASVGQDLRTLGLTWKVQARKLDDTQVEIKVGRMSDPDTDGVKGLVSIADVGFGVSQALPVVVALHVAQQGQLVYLEQPELHLHPRAQERLAEVVADAVKRGVQVVIETHSSLFLLGIQTLIAEGKLDTAEVRLHWFERDQKGVTQITTAEIDGDGSFGDWPVDFGDVSLEAQSRYMDAVDARYANQSPSESK